MPWKAPIFRNESAYDSVPQPSNKNQKSGPRLYDTRDWRVLRARFLKRHAKYDDALCVHCKARPAQRVDHIIPHKGDRKLFFDQSNWQPLCINCHNRKSARELNEEKKRRRRNG